ncbi:permease [Peptostreptococcus sp. D1]|uniref:permease n=1 Tax=Peptostreptococcus sp. D1 TaxID=72304 RepID=UPI0008EE84DE|nr:permease [Peptostreptococcus sp. D1]SFE69298.1 hypothetical protein SAMN02910278_01479 [Peptostreptococcus sp. D1]
MEIDIVSGFFQSGKTTLVKKIIKEEAAKIYDNILIINCEYGIVSYDDYKNIENINVIDIFDKDKINSEYLKSIVDEYNPDYIIIEYNGIWDLSEVLEVCYSNGYYIRNVITALDFRTMDSYFSNMSRFIVDKISHADWVVFTKVDNEDFLIVEKKKKVIKRINRGCSIENYDDLYLGKKGILSEQITRSDREIIKFALLFLMLNSVILVIKNVFPSFYGGIFQKVLGIFLSLLVQILPFLLIGAIVSSIIQIFVPQNRLNNIFSKSGFKSIFLALFGGIFFPVCDCAMIPIATSVAKKGYSIPVIITFLMAAPAVNPIVIASTYYAFPNNPNVVILRAVFGLVIAFIVGLILMFIERLKRMSVIRDDFEKHNFSDFVMDDLMLAGAEKTGKIKYIEAIVIHSKKELFKIGAYIVVGAFISACLQVLIPKHVYMQINSINMLSVIVMLIAAFFISVCSTSNSFIARSFVNMMPANSVLGFMVVGPILDITNISVLLGTFKKRFIVFLIFLVLTISFLIFSIMGNWYRFF